MNLVAMTSEMNRLTFETSPYLKQHEDNPVDWFPWGEEALTRARLENKPILLSVGYSSCHWCHVMAHESFENPAIAATMNEHFVCVKVDREERPDLDMIYQPVAQVFTRGGGWPLTVFLTPDLKPFYGGTYFPNTDKYGRPGFQKVLFALAKSFRENRADVNLKAEKITEVIRNSSDLGIADASVEKISEYQLREGIVSAAQNLVEYIDREHGGIGSAPKFPNTSALTFLWRMSQVAFVPEVDRKRFKEGVLISLDAMADGGIFDQIAGGFARYSVDAEWVIPHFEKMLYDNGLLLKIYGEVLCQGHDLSDERKSRYCRVLLKTLNWLDEEMKTDQGLFYSALDADSLNADGHLEEGAYYTWAESDFSGTEDETQLFKLMLTGLTEEARHALTLQKIKTEDLARAENLFSKLNLIRSKRARPGLDDKVLVSWTGLVVSGLSWASLALSKLGHDQALKAKTMAVNAWKAIHDHAIDSNGAMSATLQKGKPKFKAYLDDEAFFLQATLDLGRCDPEHAHEYFAWVEARVPQVIERYYDSARGGFFFNQQGQEALIHQPKNFYDQAIPSGNGVMYSVLTMIQSQHTAANFDFLFHSEEMNLFQNAFGMSEILNALLLRLVHSVKVEGAPELKIVSNPFCVFAGIKNENEAQYCFKQTCQRGFLPDDYFTNSYFAKA